MDTKLSVRQIQLALHDFTPLWNKRADLMATNISWGLLNHEADFMVMNRSGYLTEVEIKRSWEDFKADFKKKHTHDDVRIRYFYYCVPESIVDKVKDFLEKKFPNNIDRPALLCFTEDGEVGTVHFGCSYKGGRKLFIEERLQLAKLAALRFWKLLEQECDINGRVKL